MIVLDLHPKLDPAGREELRVGIVAFGAAHRDRPVVATDRNRAQVSEIPASGPVLGAALRGALAAVTAPEREGRYDHLTGQFEARDLPAMRAVIIAGDVSNRLAATARFRDDDTLCDPLENAAVEALIQLIDPGGSRAAHGLETP